MSLFKYCQLISSIVSSGGKGWNAPRTSDWTVTGTGGTTGHLDVADIATLGATIAVPVNVNVAVGTVELALYHTSARLPVILEGTGGGGGVGLGFSLPAGITYAGGDLPFGMGEGLDLPSGGIGSLLAGPKAHRVVISPNDLVTSQSSSGTPCVTLVSAAAGTQLQYSVGVAFFADRPVVDEVDLAYTKAIALVYGMQFEVGSAISTGLSYMVYKLGIRESSLPFPGARYGASIAS